MFTKIFKTATLRQSAITTSGTILSGILGIIFYAYLARNLGPANFGLLTVSIATLTLIADIADLGTNTGLVRHVSTYIHTDRLLALKYIKFSLFIKVIIWSGILIIGLALVPFIAGVIFSKPELGDSLRLVMIGVGGAMLFSFATAALQALQKFTLWSLVNITTNFFRLLLVIMVAALGLLNLFSALTIFILLPFFGFFLGLLFLPSQIWFAKTDLEIGKKLFSYNRWVALFTLVAAVSSRMDIFLNARLLSSQEVGWYGAANQLVYIVPQIIGAIGTVVAPKFASFNTIDSMLVYFKKLQLMVLGLGGVALAAIPLSFWLIPTVYGSVYTAAVPIFVILLVGMLIFLISIPVHNSIIYYFAYPQLFVWLSIGHLILVTVLGYYLISNFGAIGAAVTVLLGNAFNFLIPLAYFIRRVSK